MFLSVAPGITKNDSSSTAPEAVSQLINGGAAQVEGQVLMLEGKTRPCRKSFTNRGQMWAKGATYLFESVRKHKYTDRGMRKMLARYAAQAGITRSMSPHKWRHFLFTWLKKEGIDDALIQPYSGHATRQSLEIYSRLSLADAQPSYSQAMEHFPIQ